MLRARRVFLRLLIGLAFLPCIVAVIFWQRSISTTDVWLAPLPNDAELMLSSHWGGWVELTIARNWPDRRFGYWTGPEWRNIGPFKFWQSHRSEIVFWDVRIIEGQMAFPLATPNGPPAYDRSYSRAEETHGFEGIPRGSPDWGIVKAWEMRIPIFLILGISLIPLLLLLIIWAIRWNRIARRTRMGLCIHCGYDLRASNDKCPECGRLIPAPKPFVPLRRRIWNAGPISLILLVALAMLWVSSLNVVDLIEYSVQGSGAGTSIFSHHGTFGIRRYTGSSYSPPSFFRRSRTSIRSWNEINHRIGDSGWSFLGFSYLNTAIQNVHLWRVAVPYWPFIVAILIWRWSRRRRRLKSAAPDSEPAESLPLLAVADTSPEQP